MSEQQLDFFSDIGIGVGHPLSQNIEHYRAMLKITTDLERRAVFEKLLREEEAKLKKYDDDHKNK